MSCVPWILDKRHGNLLPRCWLAGILGERMFKRKFGKHEIAEYDIAECCKEISLVVDVEMENYRRQFSLRLYSDLMFGVVKLHSYQFMLFEKSVLDMLKKLDAIDIRISEETTRGRERIRGARPTTFSQVPIDDLFKILTPDLNLDRPFRPDTNLLIEVSPASHKRLKQLEESLLVPLSPLTASQGERWMCDDERSLWPGVDPNLLPALEFPDAAPAAQPDSPLHTVRTPTKRTSAGKNGETPSKRQRPSRVPLIMAMDEERMEAEVPPVLPMEQDDEPLAIPVEPMVTEVPEEPAPPVDFITEVDRVPAVVPMKQDDEPHPLDEHQVLPTAPEDPAASVHAGYQLEIGTIPVEPALSRKPPGRRPANRRKKLKGIDVIESTSVEQLKQRQKNVQVYTVPSQKTIAISTKRLVKVSTVIRLPSTIFNFGVEGIPRTRLRTISDDMLRTYKINICGPFDVETDNSLTIQPRDLRHQRAYDPPTVLGDGAYVMNSTENGTEVQPTEINVAPLVEVPQPEAPGEPVFDTTGGTELPLGKIDNQGDSANTSEAKTVSIGRVHISSSESQFAEHHVNLSPSDAAIHSLRPKNQVTLEKSSRSKTPSSNECIVDAERESSSPRMPATSVWTRKDLEACLEVYWHDNNVISFEQLAPPDITSDIDANTCFMLLLEMYQENKIVLIQAGTDTPMYIEKVVPSDNMDCS